MKSLIVLVAGLLAVGCGKPEPSLPSIKAEPSTHQGRKLSQEEKKVVGAYEGEPNGFTFKKVFLENGLLEQYLDGRKVDDGTKWSIVDGEIYVGELDDPDNGNAIGVYRINKDRSITNVAMIRPNGRREDIPKEVQSSSLKKIK